MLGDSFSTLKGFHDCGGYYLYCGRSSVLKKDAISSVEDIQYCGVHKRLCERIPSSSVENIKYGGGKPQSLWR